MNVGPLWIRVSFNPTTGALSSIANMNPYLEVALLDLVMQDLRDQLGGKKPSATIARPIVSQHPAVQARRVDAS